MTQYKLRLPGTSRWAEQVNKHHNSNNSNSSVKQSFATIRGDSWLNTIDFCTVLFFPALLLNTKWSTQERGAYYVATAITVFISHCIMLQVLLQELSVLSSFFLFWFCCFAWTLTGCYGSFKDQPVDLSLDLYFFSSPPFCILFPLSLFPVSTPSSSLLLRSTCWLQRALWETLSRSPSSSSSVTRRPTWPSSSSCC